MANLKGTIISLGAGENQVPFLEAAVESGYQIIGIDRKSNSPGFSLCRFKIIESVTEYRKIYSQISRLSLDEPLTAVGCRSYGKAIESQSYLAEKFSLPGNPLSVIKRFYDKAKMKKYLQQNDIRVPKQYDINSIISKRLKLKVSDFPLIYKPTDGASKKGIKLIFKTDELKKLIKKNSNAFLEEYIEGPEFTVLGFIYNGKAIIISISDKITTEYPPFLEIAHILPGSYPDLSGEIKLIVQRIISLTGLSMGPFVAEFKANKFGELYLMEIMPEVGGEYLAESLIPEYYKYNYFMDYIRLINGSEPLCKKKENKKDKYSIIRFFVPPEGQHYFKKFEVYPQEKKIKIFFEKNLLTPDSIVDTTSGNRARVKVIGYKSADFNYKEIQPQKVENMEAIFEKYE